jgi:hypothetical protein
MVMFFAGARGAHARREPALLFVIGFLGMLLAWPAGASAVTVSVGRQDLSTAPTTNFGCTTTTSCSETVSPTALTAGALAVVPGDGAITSWRVVGKASGEFPAVVLRVLRPSGGQYTFVSHSPGFPSPLLDGTPNALSPALPVAAGDVLGMTTSAATGGTTTFAEVEAVNVPGAGYNLFSDFIEDGNIVSPSLTCAPDSLACPHAEPLFNAEVALDPPIVSSVSPGSGPAAGGQTVTITGNHLAGASQVRFGGVAATNVVAVSNTEVTAVVPAHPAGEVDVTVTTLGGTSVSGSRFTFTGEGGSPPPPPPAGAVLATISALSQTHPVFAVAGASTPLSGRTARRSPRGTTFSLRLDHPANVTVLIQRQLPGRRVGHVCKPPTRQLRRRPGCTRLITVATLTRSARVGTNRIGFTGRIRGRALKPGRYRAAFSAANAAGTSPTRNLSFTIIGS